MSQIREYFGTLRLFLNKGKTPHRDTKTGDAPRHWRWRGALVDYYTAEVDALGASPTDQAADGVSASELTGARPKHMLPAATAGWLLHQSIWHA